MFKIGTVASLFSLQVQLRQEALWPWQPVSGGPWMAALEQEAQGDGLIPFRSLNKCLVGWLVSQLCSLRNRHQLGWAGNQLRLCKGQERQQKQGRWGLMKEKNKRNLVPNEYLCVYKLCINEVAPSSCQLAFFMFTHKAGPKWEFFFWCWEQCWGGQPRNDYTEE